MQESAIIMRDWTIQPSDFRAVDRNLRDFREAMHYKQRRIDDLRTLRDPNAQTQLGALPVKSEVFWGYPDGMLVPSPSEEAINNLALNSQIAKLPWRKIREIIDILKGY